MTIAYTIQSKLLSIVARVSWN